MQGQTQDKETQIRIGYKDFKNEIRTNGNIHIAIVPTKVVPSFSKPSLLKKSIELSETMTTFLRKITVYWFLVVIVITSACATKPNTPQNTHALIERAVELKKQEKYQEAYQILKPVADTGEPKANDKIADIYSDKNEKNPYYDLEKAEQSLRIAADAGIVWAMIGLAQVLKHQVGEKHKAVNYDVYHPELKKLREKNYKEACKWFEKAARQGERHAIFDTARCYQNGYATGKKDYIAAYAWFAVAEGRFEVEKGDPYAPNSMAKTFMERTERRAKFNKQQIEQALELARQFHYEIFGMKTNSKE